MVVGSNRFIILAYHSMTMNRISFTLIATLLIIGHTAIYQKYYDEALRIAVAMTLDQKIGQCLQVDFGAFSGKNKTD